jgi:DNA-binding transcriptional MerR regulator
MTDGIPIQKVIDMKSQGLNTEKIISALVTEGYAMQQIRDALQQAEIKKNVSNPAVNYAQAPTSEIAKPSVVPNDPIAQQQTPIQTKPKPMQASPQPMQRSSGINIDEIQRILEEIISEKWKESEEVIRNMIEWKAVISTKMKELETRISEFNVRVDSMNTSLGKKAEEFNQTMTDVDTEIKALDKALNKLIPALSDNISELKDIVTKK